jgi:hypothetical protein
VTTTFSIFDKAIIVVLVMVLILSISKFIEIKIDVPRKLLGDKI